MKTSGKGMCFLCDSGGLLEKKNDGAKRALNSVRSKRRKQEKDRGRNNLLYPPKKEPD